MTSLAKKFFLAKLLAVDARPAPDDALTAEFVDPRTRAVGLAYFSGPV
jgi:hypothetical protein